MLPLGQRFLVILYDYKSTVTKVLNRLYMYKCIVYHYYILYNSDIQY
jgi:hypothetical protein